MGVIYRKLVVMPNTSEQIAVNYHFSLMSTDRGSFSKCHQFPIKQIWSSRKGTQSEATNDLTHCRAYVPIFKIDVGYLKQAIYIYIYIYGWNVFAEKIFHKLMKIVSIRQWKMKNKAFLRSVLAHFSRMHWNKVHCNLNLYTENTFNANTFLFSNILKCGGLNNVHVGTN